MDNSNDSMRMDVPATTPKTNKKQGKKVVLFSIIALLVGGGIASAIFIAIGYLNNNQSNNQISDCSNDKADSVVVEPAKDKDGNEIENRSTLLDARLTAELAYKTNRIVANKPSSERSLVMDTTGTFNDYVNLSDQMRADIVIGSKIFENNPIAEKVSASDLPDSYTDKQAIARDYGYAYIIRVDEGIKSEYKYLFDKELTNLPDQVSSDFVTNSCGANYAKDASYYVRWMGCGGGSDTSHSMYQYKYELEGEKAYVYFAVMAMRDSGYDKVLYSGFINDNKILNLTAEQKGAVNTVSDSIYNSATGDYAQLINKVSHYRAVFEKGSDGDYYYKTLERVND